MSERAMAPCPTDSDLMKAWNAFQDQDAFKDHLYWATTETKMRKGRAQELGVDPTSNAATSEDRERNLKGVMWGCFMAGFAAAGGRCDVDRPQHRVGLSKVS
jgi:hypothetical protein